MTEMQISFESGTSLADINKWNMLLLDLFIDYRFNKFSECIGFFDLFSS